MASEDLPANGHGGPADPKPALRRQLRAARAAFVAGLDPADRARLEADLATVLAERLPPGTVAAYHAVGDEIDPRGLARPLVFPRTVRGQPLSFHVAPLADCRAGALGIPDPPADAPPVDPDIVLVPLLGVDRRGTRLGQGGGYYDRTLAALRAVRRVLAVGIAWDMQLVGNLPAEAWDAPLDALATPSQWLTFPPQPPMSRR